MNDRGTGRVWVIAAIVALHALLLCLWPQFSPDQNTVGARHIFITLIEPKPKPKPRPQVVTARQPNVRSKPTALTTRVHAVRQAVVQVPKKTPEKAPEKSLEPVAISVPAAPDPFAEPAPVASPKYDIAKIDREVRKESLNPAVRVTVLQAPKMERLIAGAKKQRGPTAVEEIVLNDGTRVSKVGGMCAKKKPSAMVGGYDPFRNGNETLWQECPK